MTSDRLRRALVTGATSGIGKAVAIALAKAGFEVALIGRSEEKLLAVQSEVAAFGSVAKGYAIDLADLPEVRSRIEAILQEWGPIDVLINSAGMGHTGALATTALEHWQQVIDLNLTSVFQCIQAVLPTMRSQQQGTIVNIVSVAAKSAFPQWGAYSVSKAGLLKLSQVLAAEERAHGIRVMAISPGAVNTPIWDSDTVEADFDRSRMLTPDIVAQTILNAVLLPQNAVIEDLDLMPSAGAL